MKLIPWIVALCNRNWQKKLDTMIAEVEAQEEPKLVDDELNLNMDVINQQPTHLSYKFRARAKRKQFNNKSIKHLRTGGKYGA